MALLLTHNADGTQEYFISDWFIANLTRRLCISQIEDCHESNTTSKQTFKVTEKKSFKQYQLN